MHLDLSKLYALYYVEQALAINCSRSSKSKIVFQRSFFSIVASWVFICFVGFWGDGLGVRDLGVV